MSKVEELKAQLAAAEAEVKAEREAQQKDREARWAAILRDPGSWEWRVTPCQRADFFTKEVVDGADIQRRVKPEIVAAWVAGGNGAPREEETTFRGMFYYRTDENILTQDGGGWHVLQTPKLCSDEEWNQILAGEIPSKFKRIRKR